MGQEQSQQKWQEICWNAGAPGHEAERSQACKLMAEKLGPGTPTPTRVWLLKQLERIGRGECVEEVAAVVSDSDRLVRDAAIRALANNPDPAAGDKLRDAFKDRGGRRTAGGACQCAGLPRRAGQRGGAGERRPRQRERPGRRRRRRHRALGKIGTPAAIAALEVGSRTDSADRSAYEVGDALAKCCQRLSTEGKTGRGQRRSPNSSIILTSLPGWPAWEAC